MGLAGGRDAAKPGCVLVEWGPLIRTRMNSPAGSPAPLPRHVLWLVCIIASIGFAFDTYELLMLPLVAGPALAEILQIGRAHV